MALTLAELVFVLVVNAAGILAQYILGSSITFYFYVLHGIAVVAGNMVFVFVPFVGIVYATGPGLGQSLPIVASVPAVEVFIAIAGKGGHDAAIIADLGNAVTAAKLIIVLPAEAYLVGIRHDSECRDLALGLEGIDHTLVLEVAVGTTTCIYLAEVAFLLVFLQLQVYGLGLLPVIYAGKFGLVALLIIYLYLLNGVGLQSLRHYFGVVREELFAIYQYLLYGFALRGYLTVLVYLYTGQPFKKVFHIGILLYFKAVGHVFSSVALYLYGRHLLGEYYFFEQVLFRDHGNGAEVSSRFLHIDHVFVVGERREGDAYYILTLRGYGKLKGTIVLSACKALDHGVFGADQHHRCLLQRKNIERVAHRAFDGVGLGKRSVYRAYCQYDSE